MKKHAHVILLLSGLVISFIAYLRLWASTAESSMRYLAQPVGWLTLLFEFSPFIFLAALVRAGQAFQWKRASLRASVVTNYRCLGSVDCLLRSLGRRILFTRRVGGPSRPRVTVVGNPVVVVVYYCWIVGSGVADMLETICEE
jgi:hypothetical protein